MRLIQVVIMGLFCLLAGALSAQESSDRIRLHIAHIPSAEQLLVERSANPVIKGVLNTRSLPFVELRYSRPVNERFTMAYGVFALYTRQQFNYDFIAKDDGTQPVVQPEMYTLNNFRAGLSATASYNLGKLAFSVGLGPSFRTFNHNGMYVNSSVLVSHSNGVEWSSHREEYFVEELDFDFDWHYNLGISYQLHPRIAAQFGLLGFASPFSNGTSKKQYILSSTTDLASSSGGLVFQNEIEVLKPDHYWNMGLVIDLWRKKE